MGCGMQVHIELAVEQRLGLILRQGCRPFDGALELLQRHLDTAVFARPGGSVNMTGFDRPGKTGIFDRPAKRPGCGEIGRASCRDSVCSYVSISVVSVSLKKKTAILNKIK